LVALLDKHASTNLLWLAVVLGQVDPPPTCSFAAAIASLQLRLLRPVPRFRDQPHRADASPRV